MTNKKKPGRPKKIVSGDLSRWTILISWQTRISVTKAAKRQQINLHTWIDNALSDASREVLVGKKENIDFPTLSLLSKQLAEMEELVALLKVKKPWWRRIGRSAHDI